MGKGQFILFKSFQKYGKLILKMKIIHKCLSKLEKNLGNLNKNDVLELIIGRIVIFGLCAFGKLYK